MSAFDVFAVAVLAIFTAAYLVTRAAERRQS